MGTFALSSMSTANRWPGGGKSPWSWRVRGRGFTWKEIWLSLVHFQQRILDFGACEFQSASPGLAEQSFADHNCSRVWSWGKIWSKNLAWLPPFAKKLQRWRKKRYFIWLWKQGENDWPTKKNFKRRWLDGKKKIYIQNIWFNLKQNHL